MSERAIPNHYRTSLAASTPASRIAELTSLVVRLQQELDEAGNRIETLETDNARYHSFRATSFGGITMAQHQCDLLLWEAVLNENPGLRAIVELGTWEGGFSWWLWAQTMARGMNFRTYDSVQPARRPPYFVRVDVFAHPGVVVENEEPLILFCDNGNKPREIRTFAPMLKHPDSLIVVHDWGTEFLPSDVPESVEPVYEDYCEALDSISRVFRNRRDL